MQQIHILLVDDNEGDIFLTREALDDAQIVNKISIAQDGVEAIEFLASYDNYANCYITKPVDLNRFMDVVRTIENFWISVVQLPKTHA
jgi:CheY-like chemotaxis protein